MSWLKKADPILPSIPPMSTTPKPPMSEKEDVATAEGVAKSLKALIQREKAEQEPKEVKLLEEALKKVEDFLKEEKKELEKEKKELEKEEKEKQKEKEKQEKEQQKEVEKMEKE